ncbi:hypothetical protein LTR84_012082 [Exophiala bonariae]|uniref:MacB-like periplasmic core domain-containing protein n=1 Tax=Exophiala bonariae TaxID=1690606 RepID=A0AAV9NFJ7_9EURO|nr:hypothetical protein LTR84_012082 [Exophiala bonariae]
MYLQAATGASTGVQLENRLRASVRHNTAENLGRPILDMLSHRWKTALPVQDSGKITLLDEDQEQYVRGHKVPGNFALAAGRIHVGVVLNVEGYKIDDHVTMSGFWMDGNKFVTTAQFLDLIHGTDYKETELLLRNRGFISNAGVSNAFLSGDRSGQIAGATGDNFWRVDLAFVDYASDLAVFIPTRESTEKRGDPAHSVTSADLAMTKSRLDFNLADQGTNIFIAYYPDPPQTVKQANMGPKNEREAKKAGITDAFQFMGWKTLKALGLMNHVMLPVIFFQLKEAQDINF